MDHLNYGFQNTHTTDMQEFIWKKAKLSTWNTGGLWTSDVFIYRL